LQIALEVCVPVNAEVLWLDTASGASGCLAVTYLGTYHAAAQSFSKGCEMSSLAKLQLSLDRCCCCGVYRSSSHNCLIGDSGSLPIRTY